MSPELIFQEITHNFIKRFTSEPLKVEAPGRINIIGEHTDYNEGFVLPAAIDKSVKFVIQKSESTNCILVAVDLKEEYSFSIKDDLKPINIQWANYFLGVIDELKKLNHQLTGFNLMFTSNIPIGAGLSSSAAIECGFGYALDQLFDLNISRMNLALIGQQAEHKFAGVKCGIMDQFASMMGKNGHVMKLDCRSMEYDYFRADFGQYQIVLFDTQVSHNLASSEYNIRRKQCEEGVLAIHQYNSAVNSLRDANLNDLEEAKGKIEPIVYKRCKYVIEENDRVQKVSLALNNGDISKVGMLMYETHVGLSQLYEVSCKELDFLVDSVKSYDSVIGARMMGGGFGGCTINLIKKSSAEQVIKDIEDQYLEAFGGGLKVYQVSLSDGTKVYN